VTEGQAQYRAVTLSGVTYTMLVSEDGSLQYGTSTTPLVVSPAAGTSGGCTPNSSISAGAVLETEIKATAGQLYQLVITNIDSTPVYARLYNDTADSSCRRKATAMVEGLSCRLLSGRSTRRRSRSA
jgi:hypothetical protein